MDRKHAARLKLLKGSALALLVAVGLSAAGFRPTDAIRQLLATFEDAHEVQRPQLAVQPPVVSSPIPRPKPVTILSVPTGTESSVSRQPQPLYLISTRPGQNAREGTARIGTNPEHPQTYAAGAMLANEARLAEIYIDRVVLEHRGQRLNLYISANENSALAMRSEGSQVLALVGGTPHSAPEVTLAQDSFTEVVRSMPYYENDVLRGVQVFPGDKAGTFARLGLQTNDIVTAINGLPVADATVAVERLRALAEGAALSVSVRRGSTSIEVSLDGAAAMRAAAPPPSATP